MLLGGERLEFGLLLGVGGKFQRKIGGGSADLVDGLLLALLDHCLAEQRLDLFEGGDGGALACKLFQTLLVHGVKLLIGGLRDNRRDGKFDINDLDFLRNAEPLGVFLVEYAQLIVTRRRRSLEIFLVERRNLNLHLLVDQLQVLVHVRGGYQGCRRNQFIEPRQRDLHRHDILKVLFAQAALGNFTRQQIVEALLVELAVVLKDRHRPDTLADFLVGHADAQPASLLRKRQVHQDLAAAFGIVHIGPMDGLAVLQ